MTTRRLLLATALFAPVAALAQTSPTAPAAPVEALNQGILAIMRAAQTTGFAERAQMLTPVVQSSFDLPRILRSSVGPHFASFPPAAQAELLDVFTQFTVASYVANFDDYNGERFDVLPDTRRVGADEVVQTRLVQASGDPLKLDYLMHQDGDGWKIIDVLLNGSISRVAVQRSDFRSLLGNGSADPLIASLRNKVSRLEQGQTG
jgi:phospholipid transport system substrate-binding protein